MRFSAILPAAGCGTRTNLQENKIFFPIGNRPILLHALHPFLQSSAIEQIVIAVSAADFDRVQAMVASYAKCTVLLGGESRANSVYNALQFLETTCPTDAVLIHDAARPFLSSKLLEELVQATKAHGSAVPFLPATDSMVWLENDTYKSPLNRQQIGSIQTPQSFLLQPLLQAYQAYFTTAEKENSNHLKTCNKQQESKEKKIQTPTFDSKIFTDDSSIYAKFIAPPHLVQGDRKNKKITYIEDLLTLPQQTFTGIGQDIHAFGTEGNQIVLGGVKIPSKAALIAHSDGDVLIHALMDALLSGAGLLDIGHYFPDTDPTYKDCSSLELLKQVFARIQEQGFWISNISATILAEAPKLAPHIAEMKKNIASILQLESNQIGITATTTEKLGAIGRGEGIFVTAIATLVRVFS